jgi:hypothetical protein
MPMMMMILRSASLVALGIIIGRSTDCVVKAAVDFLVTSDNTNPDNTDEYFVARIVNEAAIAIARAEILKGTAGGWQVISGTIEKSRADWNPNWSFHFIPETVFFGDWFMEVCDANVIFVEQNLDIAGDAFLPDLMWVRDDVMLLLSLF